MNRRCSFWKRTCMVVLLIGMAAAGYVLGLHAGRDDFSARESKEGPVTIYTMDGNVWGYYGNLDIIIHDDGSAEAVLNDAWLVGTTDENFY